jgi:hypothetical protein
MISRAGYNIFKGVHIKCYTKAKQVRPKRAGGASGGPPPGKKAQKKVVKTRAEDALPNTELSFQLSTLHCTNMVSHVYISLLDISE